MLIGIIGAGLSGLTAGKLLAQAGHEVVVFEKSKGFGGRLATRYAGDNASLKFDHGCSHLSATDSRYQQFIDELEDKNIVQKWADGFHYWNGETLYRDHPQRLKQQYYFAPNGMNSIGKYMSRWVDVRNNTKVIGMTYLGDKKGKKKPWMLNLENFDVFGVDAVVVATPAVQAYGLIENSQDETVFRNVIREIDEIFYEPKHALMLSYENVEIPDWKGITCNDQVLGWISNENSKRDDNGKLALVCHSNGEFTKKHLVADSSIEKIQTEMIFALRNILGDWAGKYADASLHLWRYSQPRTFFDKDFVEIGDGSYPVAIIGDYLRGNTSEHAFISGVELAKSWISRFPVSK
jgi:renalase